MTFAELELPGCYEIQLPKHSDPRGSFTKTFAESRFAEHGLRTDFVESFFTISEANVLRGMHFQLPPADHAKVVYCLAGSILDVCLDLRTDSPTFGRFSASEVSAARNNAIYMPSGIAHGFYVLEAPALTMYHVTSEHDAKLDTGIAWDSFSMEWPTKAPVLSARDAAWPKLVDFKSPFHMSEAVVRGTR